MTEASPICKCTNQFLWEAWSRLDKSHVKSLTVDMNDKTFFSYLNSLGPELQSVKYKEVWHVFLMYIQQDF